MSKAASASNRMLQNLSLWGKKIILQKSSEAPLCLQHQLAYSGLSVLVAY